MASSDRLNFSQEKIFKKVCENLQKSDGKTKNLIDCKEDIIFVWDSKEKRLLTQILKVYNKDVSAYQELHPTEPPLTDIQFIRVNPSLTKVALWGPGGLMALDVPRRWGSQGAFQGGKPIILTKSNSIDMRYFLLHNVEVRQIRFHPGSPKDDCLVVLTSDNALRVYRLKEVGEGSSEPELIHVWALSQNPAEGRGWNLRGSKIPFLASLGDVAVDFDFGLSFIEEEFVKDEDFGLESVVWPAIILRGNGDVCILKTSLMSSQKLKFEGPLTMYPPADDNYGVEACSILVLPTTPSVIVVATSSGTLYHSVLLEINENEKEDVVSTHGLLVLESVELELGIQLNDEDPSYSYPVILHSDPVCRWKYYCTHNTGLHAVSASFICQLEQFFEKASVEKRTVSFSLDQSSTVEYLICTRTNTTPVLPVLGFTVIPSSNVILALLANGDLVSLPLKITEVLISKGFISEEVAGEETTPIKKLLQEPFDVHIRTLLKRNINQPLMKLDKNVTLSAQESLDLISRTTNILRQEYFTKFQLVRDEIEQRVMTLRALQSLHLNELQQLENEKVSLQAMAEKLAEKYEEIKDRQQILNQRIEKVVSAVLEVEPIESLAEKKMKNELVAIEEKIENFKKSISRLKKEMDYQKHKKAEHQLEKQKSIKLGGNQIETIKTSLNKTSQEISELVKVVNAIKKQLKIVDV